MAETEKQGLAIHWPILVLGIFVAVLFIAVLFVFQVHEVELAIVARLGKPREEMQEGKAQVQVFSPGLHMKIPFVDSVWKHQRGYQVYELKRGQVEEMQTADDIQLLVSTFVVWRVGDVYQFYKRIETTPRAEKRLDEIVRNSRSNVVGRHPLDHFINVEEEELQLEQIEQEILEEVRSIAMEEYGIEIKFIGIKHLGFPQSVTQEVEKRMRTERESKADEILAEGEKLASQIRTEADAEAETILIDARTEATRIRGEGDEVAAEYYSAFSASPELAIFLRKLEALRETLTDENTTLILDTNTSPFDLLRPDAIDLKALRQEGASEDRSKDSETGTAPE